MLEGRKKKGGGMENKETEEKEVCSECGAIIEDAASAAEIMRVVERQMIFYARITGKCIECGKAMEKFIDKESGRLKTECKACGWGYY